MRLEKGKHGASVGELHQLLLERGLSVAKDELSLQMFGETTDQLVREYQEQNVDEHSRPLIVDGVVGPRTMTALKRMAPPQNWIAPDWHCELSALEKPIKDVVQEAVSDLGRREDPDGSNSGAMIYKFFPPGVGAAPWCAYAVSTWLEAAPGGSPLPYRIGSVAGLVNWGTKRGLIVGDPRPGDLWCALRGPGQHGHVELVVHRFDSGKIATVGGNVRNAVRGVTRQPGSWTHVIRPIP
jgi:hypothetical protein